MQFLTSDVHGAQACTFSNITWVYASLASPTVLQVGVNFDPIQEVGPKVGVGVLTRVGTLLWDYGIKLSEMRKNAFNVFHFRNCSAPLQVHNMSHVYKCTHTHTHTHTHTQFLNGSVIRAYCLSHYKRNTNEGAAMSTLVWISSYNTTV